MCVCVFVCVCVLCVCICDVYVYGCVCMSRCVVGYGEPKKDIKKKIGYMKTKLFTFSIIALLEK